MGLHHCDAVSRTPIPSVVSPECSGQGDQWLVLSATLAGNQESQITLETNRDFCPFRVSEPHVLQKGLLLVFRGPKLPYTELTWLTFQIAKLIDHGIRPEWVSASY